MLESRPTGHFSQGRSCSPLCDSPRRRLTHGNGNTTTAASFVTKRVEGLAPSPTIAVSDKARRLKSQGIDVVDLGGGDPDFITPEHIRRAAIEAMNRATPTMLPVPESRRSEKRLLKSFARTTGLRSTLLAA